MSTKNIVLFGQTGAGKSSVVNLMAGKQRAKTSGDSFCCTLEWEKHSIAIDGHDYNVFDTVGLEEPSLGIEEYLDAILNARSLIKTLENEGGIDLLMFCVRAGRFTSTIRNNYRLFYEWLCEKKFPIVLVITGLERETNMEDWWTTHGSSFQKHNIFVDGHACITAANNMDGRHERLYQESRKVICDLVKEHTHNGQGAWEGGEGRKEGSTSTKNIVLFGQTGAGKSSIVNLMAGEKKADTSGDLSRCTLEWKNYPIVFDGYSYNVFDTVGLEEPSLGIKEHPNAISNARTLIKKLENEGGIDLLIFCVRSGRLTSTIQNNYRLFYERLCERKFSIVLVITGLERETNMEDWWIRHGSFFQEYKISVNGHACITAANDMDGKHEELYQASRKVIRDLVKEYTHNRQGAQKGGERWKEGDRLNNEKWLGRFRRQMTELLRIDHFQKKGMVTTLVKRGLAWEDAQLLAGQIVQDLADRKSGIS